MVVAEAITTPDTGSAYAALIERHDVLLVGVRCPLQVAQQRERDRSDRLNGLVELDVPEFHLVHQQAYELTVETDVEPTAESVQRILRLPRLQAWGRDRG